LTTTNAALHAVPAGQWDRLGLKIEPYFTTSGVHPYDELEWELRDAVIKDWKTGAIAFEQRDVEVPKSWSHNATAIVAQKYFRGRLGTPDREYSVRHMIDRVADTITSWGRKDGYFADAESADAFNLGLKHLLVQQKAAFNSPVWFNVGVDGRVPQCSACFILSVEDTMGSILNWYVEEGTIFKGGSGSGVNLSRIRSSVEPLAGGGTASGPVSFMRGADASAGTIKSGGTTRRAAKMVILNVDHPDIEEFIWCKQREELKARALREAGFDMDLDGRDFSSIQYQNANNSVRVTDEFMETVLIDEEFTLRAVTTGEPIKVVRARDLMRQIAQAAWECADPGIQYDTTINDWHTTPNAGRINGSNPCSEYMHLDNSACNLASLNLRKFETDSIFDVEAFRRAVEIMFTAQEIIVDNSSYPTEKIAANAKAYRQLGLGYANLGGLLMSLGLAYDSDEGRAWAAAITALMTGHAYRTSAEIARVTGSFEGYAQDRDGMLRVLRKHRAAVENIDVRLAPANVLSAARQAWDDAVVLGTEYGVRNAQASVLAPTGTIGLMMDCDTTGIEPDLGLVKSKKLVGGGTMRIVNRTVPVALRRLGYEVEQIEAIVQYIDEHSTIEGAPALKPQHLPVFDCAMGERSISAMGHVTMMAAVQPFISGALSKCVVGETLLTTGDGLVRIGSLYRGEKPDTFRDEILEIASLGGPTKTDAFYYGGMQRVRKALLRSGHTVTGTGNHRVLVASEGAGLIWRCLGELQPGEYVAVQYGSNLWSTLPARFDDFRPGPRHSSHRTVEIPAEMNVELAFLLGAYAARGRTVGDNRIVITSSQPAALSRMASAWCSAFGIEPENELNSCPQVFVRSQAICEFFEYLGCGDCASGMRVPDAILCSPREMVLAFLQGLTLDAAVTKRGQTPTWTIRLDSSGLLDDLQAVLTNLGVVHTRTSDGVEVAGSQARRLLQLVPSTGLDNITSTRSLLLTAPDQRTVDVVPGLYPRELYGLIPRSSDHRSAFAFLCNPRIVHVSWETLDRVSGIPGVKLPEWLQRVLADNLRFSQVESVTDDGEREVFDISVPISHAFVGNGVVNHNTVNLPESATVEDLEHLYLEGWRRGLKALAVYRDNCKVAQPLSLATKKETSNTTEQAAAQAGMVRRRLPKQRPSQTISFQVGDAEGYLTAGEYPGDGLGEIFVKLGKQGSTLSGVMDAFAISVSIGLQYGVPLEVYVRKFTNMRFEPAGMTDDPEVRFATSIVDYLFRRLAIEYLPADRRQALGIYTMEERAVLEGAAPTPQPWPAPVAEITGQTILPPGDRPTPVDDTHRDAPMCYQCGVAMIRAGSCHCCPQCGTTSGCS
jgi:adenosylcobalamin-dependent ribonucleoside-diphosphate reductase